MTKKNLFWLAGLLCLLCAVPARAEGVVIKQEQRKVGAADADSRTTFYLGKAKIRIETSGRSANSVMIFDGERKVLWMVDAQKKTYYEMTEEDVAAMSATRKKMQERMAGMPAAQRAMMEKMMKGRMSRAPTVEIQKVRSGEKIGDYTCTVYEVSVNGERSSEVWTASADQLQLRPEDFSVFQAMAKMLEPLSRNMPGAAASPLAAGGGQMDGFPVRTVTYRGDKPVTESKVIGVERRYLEDALFTVPDGYKKKKMGR